MDKAEEQSLRWAARGGDVGEVGRLADRGVNVNAADPESGQTSLHTAASCGQMDVLKELVARGADLSVRDKDGKTPVDLVRSDRVGVREYLEGCMKETNGTSSGTGEAVQERKRKRGRPPKLKVDESKGPPPLKRGRGRPRKARPPPDAPPQDAHATPVRKRGRPPKNRPGPVPTEERHIASATDNTGGTSEGPARSAPNGGSVVIIVGDHFNGVREILGETWVLHMEGDKIVRFYRVDDDAIDTGTYTYDFRGKYVLPGLVDCHVHPALSTEDYQKASMVMSHGEKALLAQRRLLEMADYGWTTVRVAGDPGIGCPSLDVRDHFKQFQVVAPRVVGAGHYISVTGGGGDLNQLRNTQCRCLENVDGLIADGKEAMIKCVRQEVQDGADWIKILASGAYMSAGDDPTRPHFSAEELAGIMEESGRRNVPVMAHCHAADSIVMCADAGVRSIEHASFLDERGTRAILKRRGSDNECFIVPTLLVGDWFTRNSSPSGAQAKMLRLQEEKDRTVFQNLHRGIVQHGVRFCVGTDYVGWQVGENWKELRLLVEKVGLEAHQVLVAATSAAGEMLRMPIGRLQPTYLADFIVVERSPLERQFESLSVRPHRVCIGGRFRPMELLVPYL